jgi:starch phosphorylase
MVGDRIRTSARVQLAGLTPEDVTVELYVGRVAAGGDLVDAEPVRMDLVSQDGDSGYVFQADAALGRRSGLNGYTVRVLPANPDLATPFQPGLIVWATGSLV